MDAAIAVTEGRLEGGARPLIVQRIRDAVSVLRRCRLRYTRPVEWQTFTRDTPLFAPQKPLIGVYGEEITGRYAARRWTGEAMEYRDVTEEEFWDCWDCEQW